ncbi:hypothetical protein M0813_20618 [Anaeramoeba flamelloides]|uniref:Uncharacterized protein n=1 Tax=Anaeramoeba flamelloides TaxID=1746091 RepID=A0ABQ8YKG9_9EUKA|nr:hypothetical protein M0813_20618 [Anaeramoeba flamelloides]
MLPKKLSPKKIINSVWQWKILSKNKTELIIFTQDPYEDFTSRKYRKNQKNPSNQRNQRSKKEPKGTKRNQKEPKGTKRNQKEPKGTKNVTSVPVRRFLAPEGITWYSISSGWLATLASKGRYSRKQQQHIHKNNLSTKTTTNPQKKKHIHKNIS